VSVPLLGILLRNTLNVLLRRLQAGLAEAGYPQIRAAHSQVFTSMRPEGSRITDLAERAQISKQAMGYLVDDMVRAGFLQRVADPRDRRATQVQLTQRGREVERVARGIIEGIEADWARRIGQAQLDELRAALRALSLEEAVACDLN
jgi:DNA-binding MarR family transcriptional regulator